MKKLTLLSICTLLLGTISIAQEQVIAKGTHSQSAQEVIYEPVEVKVDNKDLTDGGGFSNYFYYGNPGGMFLDKDWLEGIAYLTVGSELSGDFRYNLYMQKMEAIVDGDTFAIAKPSELEMLSMGERSFVYSSYVRGDYEVANSWFEIITDGKCKLLLRRYIKYHVLDEDGDVSNDKLYRVKEFYVQHDGGKLERLPLSKEAVKKALADHEKEVCDYMKAEKLKIKDQADLAKLFAYYNTLN